MAKIFLIPSHVISQIAAGEVIERPVYAVKELVENALDAGASRITVQIEASGLKKIVVTDDGEGMNKDDLLQSFKPHTTSKLIDESLVGIQTLGFRGEALASIAAISTMTLQSRARDQKVGTKVTIVAGNVQSTEPVGMPAGTSVTVENLFYTVPARKKFLKSERTEFRQIVDLITRYALVFPEIRFLLTHNSRVMLDLPANQTPERRTQMLLTHNVASQMFPIHSQDSYISISGYLAHPQFSANSMQKQYIFLNNRPISDRTVSASVKDSYGSLLEKTRYPVFMLFLTIPHEAVDVNVHPRKEQVSFVNQDSVSAFIRSAVTQTLAKYNLGFTSPLSNIYSPRAGTTQSESAQMLREEEALWNVKDPLLLIDTIPIQQIHDTYLVVQTKSGVVIIDQHAAHERILYEQLLSSYTKKIQDKYVLKNPVSLELTASEKEVITEYHSVFVTAGFDIRKKGKSMVVHAIPKLFKDRDLLQLIRELADDLSQKGTVTVIDSVSHTMITYLACRGAIKAGDKLTQNEAKRLIEKLAQTPNNATCPHGRPTRIELPIRELHTWFKRE